MKGKDVTMNRGTTFEVFTDQTHAVVQKTVTAQDLGARPAAPEPEKPVAVKISSDKPGADIELDGAFIGSTPTTINVTPGVHKIVVKSGAATWEREIQIRPGSDVTVMATLPSEIVRANARKH
jgi:diacylglycerol kinase family enzyme